MPEIDHQDDGDEPTTDQHGGRRAFLIGAAGAALAACSGNDDATSTTAPGSAAPTPASDQAVSEEGASEEAVFDDAVSEGGVPAETDPTGSVPPLTPAMFAALPICSLTPSANAGPFPSPELLDRRDITEGYPGHPLRLGIRVVDDACEPVSGARVDIWHADATGDYSAFTDNGSGKDEGTGTAFLRGIQRADDDGILEFQTLYPGWYEGRAVHIHATVHTDAGAVLTTQLYFDETTTDQIYLDAPYAEFGAPDTGWDNDGLIGDPATDGTGIATTPAVTALGDGTLGLINLGIRS